MGVRRQDFVAHICYLPGCAHLLAIADAFEREPDDPSKPRQSWLCVASHRANMSTKYRSRRPTPQRAVKRTCFKFMRCVAVGPPAEWRSFLFQFGSDPWRMRGVCTFHQSVWTTGLPIPLRGLLCIVAKLLFWCSGSSSDEMLRLQGRIQWHVNRCVFVFDLSISPVVFFARAVPQCSLVLCSILWPVF